LSTLYTSQINFSEISRCFTREWEVRVRTYEIRVRGYRFTNYYRRVYHYYISDIITTNTNNGVNWGEEVFVLDVWHTNQPTDQPIYPPTHLLTSCCYRQFRISSKRYIFEYNKSPIYPCAENTITKMVYRSIESIRKITDVHHTYFRRAIEDGVLLAMLARPPTCQRWITVSDGSLNSWAEGETHTSKKSSLNKKCVTEALRMTQVKWERQDGREKERDREREEKYSNLEFLRK